MTMESEGEASPPRSTTIPNPVSQASTGEVALAAERCEDGTASFAPPPSTSVKTSKTPELPPCLQPCQPVSVTRTWSEHVTDSGSIRQPGGALGLGYDPPVYGDVSSDRLPSPTRRPTHRHRIMSTPPRPSLLPSIYSPYLQGEVECVSPTSAHTADPPSPSPAAHNAQNNQLGTPVPTISTFSMIDCPPLPADEALSDLPPLPHVPPAITTLHQQFSHPTPCTDTPFGHFRTIQSTAGTPQEASSASQAVWGSPPATHRHCPHVGPSPKAIPGTPASPFRPSPAPSMLPDISECIPGMPDMIDDAERTVKKFCAPRSSAYVTVNFVPPGLHHALCELAIQLGFSRRLSEPLVAAGSMPTAASGPGGGPSWGLGGETSGEGTSLRLGSLFRNETGVREGAALRLRPVVFYVLSQHPQQHVFWRDIDCTCVCIPEDSEGHPDLEILDAQLQRHSAARLLLGVFPAASAATGDLTDIAGLCTALHRRGALAAIDYATPAAPAAAAAAAVCFSEGGRRGPDAAVVAAGALAGVAEAAYALVYSQAGVAESSMMAPAVESFLTDPSPFRTISCDIPVSPPKPPHAPPVASSAVIAAASKVLECHMAIGMHAVNALSQAYAHRARTVWALCPSILMLTSSASIEGSMEGSRTGLAGGATGAGEETVGARESAAVSPAVIGQKGVTAHGTLATTVSFCVVTRSGKLAYGADVDAQHDARGGVEEVLPFERELLSHQFVAALLRDVFGIKVSCVSALGGPYGLPLLEPLMAMLNATNANALQQHLFASRSLPEPSAPPGWCQVHFSHLMQPYEVDYVIRAVVEVGAHGWKLLSQYRLDAATGEFYHKSYSPAGNLGALPPIAMHKGASPGATPPQHSGRLEVLSSGSAGLCPTMSDPRSMWGATGGAERRVSSAGASAAHANGGVGAASASAAGGGGPSGHSSQAGGVMRPGAMGGTSAEGGSGSGGGPVSGTAARVSSDAQHELASTSTPESAVPEERHASGVGVGSALGVALSSLPGTVSPPVDTATETMHSELPVSGWEMLGTHTTHAAAAEEDEGALANVAGGAGDGVGPVASIHAALRSPLDTSPAAGDSSTTSESVHDVGTPGVDVVVTAGAPLATTAKAHYDDEAVSDSSDSTIATHVTVSESASVSGHVTPPTHAAALGEEDSAHAISTVRPSALVMTSSRQIVAPYTPLSTSSSSSGSDGGLKANSVRDVSRSLFSDDDELDVPEGSIGEASPAAAPEAQPQRRIFRADASLHTDGATAADVNEAATGGVAEEPESGCGASPKRRERHVWQQTAETAPLVNLQPQVDGSSPSIDGAPRHKWQPSTPPVRHAIVATGGAPDIAGGYRGSPVPPASLPVPLVVEPSVTTTEAENGLPTIPTLSSLEAALPMPPEGVTRSQLYQDGSRSAPLLYSPTPTEHRRHRVGVNPGSHASPSHSPASPAVIPESSAQHESGSTSGHSNRAGEPAAHVVPEAPEATVADAAAKNGKLKSCGAHACSPCVDLAASDSQRLRIELKDVADAASAVFSRAFKEAAAPPGHSVGGVGVQGVEDNTEEWLQEAEELLGAYYLRPKAAAVALGTGVDLGAWAFDCTEDAAQGLQQLHLWLQKGCLCERPVEALRPNTDGGAADGLCTVSTAPLESSSKAVRQPAAHESGAWRVDEESEDLAAAVVDDVGAVGAVNAGGLVEESISAEKHRPAQKKQKQKSGNKKPFLLFCCVSPKTVR